jgi:adenine-specific DNA-methyltransferase
LCKQLLAGKVKHDQLSSLLDQIARLSINERHYWIGTLYALLLPAAQRRAQAAYFTPPHLAQAVVSLVCKQGFDLHKHTAIDPAAGGAAFLSTLAAEMRKHRVPTVSIIDRLHGIEIDSGLARLSEALIANRIAVGIENGAIVAVGNSLTMRTPDRFDLVLANPPYGRVSRDDVPERQALLVCHPGHINKYALFTELCFRLAKPGGLVGLVLPSSFIAGPLYNRLRTFIRNRGEILDIGSVVDREDVFVDVAQDVSVIVARAGTPHRVTANVAFGHFTGLQPFKACTATKLPPGVGEPWTIPAASAGLITGGATLDDYGATVRSGYFVWNREKDRLVSRSRSKLVVPLVWAQNVRAGAFCFPGARAWEGIDFVRFTQDTPAIVRRHAIVMQRTTNSRQPRRLIAARISPSVFKKWGGFVSENHTLTITANDIATLDMLCLLLNSGAVDTRYRQLSGTASVSVTLLRGLDLAAIEAAYVASWSDTMAAGA